MTQGDERDTSYAQQYLDKVQETFSDDHAKYREFLLIIDKFGREDNFLEVLVHVDGRQSPLLFAAIGSRAAYIHVYTSYSPVGVKGWGKM